MLAEFTSLPLARINPSKTNPRKTFNPDEMADLERSIRDKGIVIPLLVRPMGDDYELVAGERRSKAAAAAGLTDVPVRIMQLTDQQALEIQVVENLQRADVHPAQEAAAYKMLLEQYNYGFEDLAARVGKTESYIRQRMAFVKLTPTCIDAFEAGEIGIGHAKLIAALSPEQQADALKYATKSQFGGHKPSVRDLRETIARSFGMELKTAPFKTSSETLYPAAGACTKCPKNSTNIGKLFADEDLKKDAQCLDSACYKIKLQAHIAIKIESGVQPLHGDWNLKKAEPGAILEKDWHETQTGEKGIVIDSHRAGRIANYTLQKHKAPSESGPSSSEAANRKAAKVATEVHRTILNDIFERQSQMNILAKEPLVFIAIALFRNAGQAGRQWLTNLDPAKVKEDYDQSKTAEKLFEDMDPKLLNATMIYLALLPTVAVSTYGDVKRIHPTLLDAAEAYNIDADAIKTQLQPLPKPAPKAKKKAKAE